MTQNLYYSVQIDKTKDILRRDTESESKARQALSGLLSEKNQNQKAIEEKQKEIGEKQKDIQEKRNQLAVLEEMAYTVDQVRLRAKRPDWFPDPPSQILGAVAGPFIGAVGVPSYYVKTEVSRQAMIDAQTGAEYFEARDKYNAAHANVALGRINEEIARYFGAVMELSGAMINFGSIRPKASGGGGNNPGGRRPPGGIPGGGDDEPGGGPPSGGGGNKPGGGGSEPSSTALTRQTPKTGAVQRTLNNLRRAVDAVKRANEGYKDLKLGISIKIRNLYDKATNFFKK